MINSADFENMPTHYKLAGEKICEYIRLVDKVRKKEDKCDALGSDCELLRLYSSGKGLDCDFDRIQELSDLYALDVDDDGMMSINEAKAILDILTEEYEVIEAEQEVLEGAAREAKIVAKRALYDALRLSRKAKRISYKFDSSYLEFRGKLNPCLTQKKTEQIAIHKFARSLNPDMIASIKKLLNPG